MDSGETRYKGKCFNSELEARWAVFFDALGVAYERATEAVDLGELGQCTPGFKLGRLSKKGSESAWIEIRSEPPTDDDVERCVALAKATQCDGFIIAGAPGFREGQPTYSTTAILHDDRSETGVMALRSCAWYEHSWYPWIVCPECGGAGIGLMNEHLPCGGCAQERSGTASCYEDPLAEAYKAAREARFESAG